MLAVILSLESPVRRKALIFPTWTLQETAVSSAPRLVRASRVSGGKVLAPASSIHTSRNGHTGLMLPCASRKETEAGGFALTTAPVMGSTTSVVAGTRDR